MGKRIPIKRPQGTRLSSSNSKRRLEMRKSPGVYFRNSVRILIDNFFPGWWGLKHDLVGRTESQKQQNIIELEVSIGRGCHVWAKSAIPCPIQREALCGEKPLLPKTHVFLRGLLLQCSMRSNAMLQTNLGALASCNC